MQAGEGPREGGPPVKGAGQRRRNPDLSCRPDGPALTGH